MLNYSQIISVRGTCFYALSLTGLSLPGRELLEKNNWTVVVNLKERWPFHRSVVLFHFSSADTIVKSFLYVCQQTLQKCLNCQSPTNLMGIGQILLLMSVQICWSVLACDTGPHKDRTSAMKVTSTFLMLFCKRFLLFCSCFAHPCRLNFLPMLSWAANRLLNWKSWNRCIRMLSEMNYCFCG